MQHSSGARGQPIVLGIFSQLEKWRVGAESGRARESRSGSAGRRSAVSQPGDVRVPEASPATSLPLWGRNPGNRHAPTPIPTGTRSAKQRIGLVLPHAPALRTREEAGGSSSCLAQWKHQEALRPMCQHLCLGPSPLRWLLTQPQPVSLCLHTGLVPAQLGVGLSPGTPHQGA